MIGIVEEVGFRASRVRTFEGAEVIVPNSYLVAEQVAWARWCRKQLDWSRQPKPPQYATSGGVA